MRMRLRSAGDPTSAPSPPAASPAPAFCHSGEGCARSACTPPPQPTCWATTCRSATAARVARAAHAHTRLSPHAEPRILLACCMRPQARMLRLTAPEGASHATLLDQSRQQSRHNTNCLAQLWLFLSSTISLFYLVLLLCGETGLVTRAASAVHSSGGSREMKGKKMLWQGSRSGAGLFTLPWLTSLRYSER